MPTAALRPCLNCSIGHSPTRKGRCKSCDWYFRRHGTEKPPPAHPPTCLNCGGTRRIVHGRCAGCYQYFKRIGQERPQSSMQRALDAKAGNERRCEECSRYFVLRGATGRFCSPVCQLKAWISANPRRRAAHWAKRRALEQTAIRGGDIITITDLFSRVNGVCGVCRDAVNLSLRVPDKLAATIDHIVPLSKGGPHTWANVQLAHAVCNSRKGDRVI